MVILVVYGNLIKQLQRRQEQHFSQGFYYRYVHFLFTILCDYYLNQQMQWLFAPCSRRNQSGLIQTYFQWLLAFTIFSVTIIWPYVVDFFDLSLVSSCKFEYSLVDGVDTNVVTALPVVTDMYMYTQEKHFQNVLIIQSLPLDLFFLKISFALHIVTGSTSDFRFETFFLPTDFGNFVSNAHWKCINITVSKVLSISPSRWQVLFC